MSNALGLALSFAGSLVAGFLGFAAALAMFRGRFVAIERDQANAKERRDEMRSDDRGYLEKELARVRDDCREQIARVEKGIAGHEAERRRSANESARRQLATLELVADLAKKGGVQNRVFDVIPKLLIEGAEDG